MVHVRVAFVCEVLLRRLKMARMRGGRVDPACRCRTVVVVARDDLLRLPFKLFELFELLELFVFFAGRGERGEATGIS